MEWISNFISHFLMDVITPQVPGRFTTVFTRGEFSNSEEYG